MGDCISIGRWGRTVAMNEALCEKFGGGAFPSAASLARLDVNALQKEAGVGYRAKSIKKLAQQVCTASRQ